MAVGCVLVSAAAGCSSGSTPGRSYTPRCNTAVRCRWSTPSLADHAEAVVKEAVSNAVRHADAIKLTIHIDVTDGRSIDVIDNGKGIPDEITASGLANLRQLARKANGTFTIQAVPEGGTRQRWSAPLP